MAERSKDCRSWWHEEARRMKRQGTPMTEIAKKFGKNYQTVAIATRGIKATTMKGPRASRGFKTPSSFKAGPRAQLAVRFPEIVMARLNIVAKTENKSLSSLVVELVQEALSVEGVKTRPTSGWAA